MANVPRLEALPPELQALVGREAHGPLGIFDPGVIPARGNPVRRDKESS